MPTTATKSDVRKIPKLRFPEFEGDWEQKRLGDVFSKKQERNTDNKLNHVLTNSAVRGIVGQSDYFDKEIANQDNLTNYFIVDLDDFIYNPRISNFAPVGPLKRNTLIQGIMSPLYTVLTPKKGNLTFFEKYFDTAKWHGYMYKIANYGARHDRMNILQSDFLNMPLPFPEISEQKKIADFLSFADKWIETLRSQKEALESYKAGMLRKIFTQEIRFKDDNGLEFPEWEEKALTHVLVPIPTKNYQIFNSDILIEGKYKVVDQGSELISGYSNNTDKIFKDTPVIIFGDHTTNLKYIDFNFVIGADGTKILARKRPDDNMKFLYYALQSNPLKSEGYKRHYSILKEKTLFLAHPHEQQKIADFLTSIDKLIESKQKQISLAEEWKKGLMQNLFV